MAADITGKPFDMLSSSLNLLRVFGLFLSRCFYSTSLLFRVYLVEQDESRPSQATSSVDGGLARRWNGKVYDRRANYLSNEARVSIQRRKRVQYDQIMQNLLCPLELPSLGKIVELMTPGVCYAHSTVAMNCALSYLDPPYEVSEQRQPEGNQFNSSASTRFRRGYHGRGAR